MSGDRSVKRLDDAELRLVRWLYGVEDFEGSNADCDDTDELERAEYFENLMFVTLLSLLSTFVDLSVFNLGRKLFSLWNNA